MAAKKAARCHPDNGRLQAHQTTPSRPRVAQLDAHLISRLAAADPYAPFADFDTPFQCLWNHPQRQCTYQRVNMVTPNSRESDAAARRRDGTSGLVRRRGSLNKARACLRVVRDRESHGGQP